jgi:hypothetical protein
MKISEAYVRKGLSSRSNPSILLGLWSLFGHALAAEGFVYDTKQQGIIG